MNYNKNIGYFEEHLVEPIAQCGHCGDELYKDDEIFQVRYPLEDLPFDNVGDYVCSDCCDRYLNDLREIFRVTDYFIFD